MRVNSVQSQNYNKKQVNFGCDYCRLTKEMLVRSGMQSYDVESVLFKLNPYSLGARVVSELKKINVTPEKLHYGRAASIFEGIKTAKQIGGRVDKNNLESIAKIIRDQFDDTLAIQTGNDFNLYL